MRDEFDLPDDAPGRYIPLRADAPHHRAYYPDPLPPSIDLPDELVSLYGEAMHAIGRLDGVVSEVENPSSVFTAFLYKEAEQSSRIEGTRVTVSDIATSGLDAETEQAETDVLEARNYVRALRDGIEFVDTAGRSWSSITTELIKSLHNTLMEDDESEPDPRPGEFRSDLVFIEERTEPWKSSIRFTPPKPEMARGRMGDLAEYIHSGGQYPELIDAALIHYQFETIHPFVDGNGRTGRLLVMLLLYCAELLVTPVLYLSSFINRNRDAYTDKLLAVSERGEWLPWIRFFLDGIREQATEAFVRAKLLSETQRTYVDRYGDERDSVFKLAMALFEQPFVTIDEAATRIDMTYQTASEAVDRLVADDVLERATERDWGVVYRARDIMNAIERDTATLPEPADVAAGDSDLL